MYADISKLNGIDGVTGKKKSKNYIERERDVAI